METYNQFKPKCRTHFSNVGCCAELIKCYVVKALSAKDKEEQTECILKIHEVAERIKTENKALNKMINDLKLPENGNRNA